MIENLATCDDVYIIVGDEGWAIDISNLSIKMSNSTNRKSRFYSKIDEPLSGQYQLEIALSAGFELTKGF